MKPKIILGENGLKIDTKDGKEIIVFPALDSVTEKSGYLLQITSPVTDEQLDEDGQLVVGSTDTNLVDGNMVTQIAVSTDTAEALHQLLGEHFSK